MEELHPSIKKIHDNNQIIFQVYRGSFVYGTYIEGKSDKDIGGIYMSDFNDVLGYGYKPQVSDEKGDTVFYDLKRFLELAQTNKPSILELMFTPEKFHIYKHPLMNLILDNKEKFLTKLCEKTLLGYAHEQIKKAKGLDKKMNWEKEHIERKNVLDYCFVPENYQSSQVSEWLLKRGLKQEYCGLSKLPHMKDVYSVFYDFRKHLELEKNNNDLIKLSDEFGLNKQLNNIDNTTLNYKGIVQKLVKTIIYEPDGTTSELFMPPNITEEIVESSKFERLSNDVYLSEIQKTELSICFLNFNKYVYSTHCKKYNEYQEWLKKRNTNRLVDVQNHGQKIDGKNMLHCVRLIKTVKEIAEGKGLIIERPDAQELLKIRRGEVDLQTLIDWSEEELSSISGMFEKSNLPESVDPVFVNDLLIEMRKEYYQLNKKGFLDKLFDKNLLKSFTRIH